MIKLSDYIMEFLADLGVKHVFMLPGGGAMHLNDSLGSCHRLEYICNLHEQASAIAAEAYAKVSNQLGVVMVTAGPGGTNTVTGVAGAWLDSTPCLFLSGQVKRADLKADWGVRQLGVQEVDIVTIVESITKYAVTVVDPKSIRYHLEKAVYLASAGRPGPVWLDIPLDVQAAMIEPEALDGFTQPAVNADLEHSKLASQVAEVISLLNEADRPVILAGNGVRLAGGQAEFLQAIKLLDCPVLATWLAMDLFPDAEPAYIGRPGGMAARGPNFALQNSDFLLSLGSRLDMVITGYAHDRLARAARKVMVDVDAAEINKMRTTIDVAICADVKAFFRELFVQAASIRHKDRTDWKQRCLNWKTRYPIVLPEHRELKGRVSTYFLSEILSEELPEGATIVTGSSGTGIEIFLHAFRPKTGQRVIFTTALGAMGFGLPASIGACVGVERKQTVCVDGDGGFQMNIQELATIERLQLPIKFFIINNDGYASIRASQKGYFGDDRLVAADPTSGLKLPDVKRVASAYGIPSMLISDASQLRERVHEVLSAPGPIVCEVLAPPDEPRAPRISTVQRPDGSMVSKPLEDLWPFLDRDEFMENMIIPPVEE